MILVTSKVSAQTVDLGGRVDLQLQIVVPPGSHVTAPARLIPSGDVEPLGPPRWQAAAGEEGAGAVLHISYPLLVLGTEQLTTPAVELRWSPLNGRTDGNAIPGGSRLSVESGANTTPGEAQTRIEPIVLDVRSAGRLEGVLEGLEPASPADVHGASFSSSAAVLITVAIAAAVFLPFAMWRARRRQLRSKAEPATVTSHDGDAIALAVAALDSLLARIPDDSQAVRDWIGACDAVVRQCLEARNPDWQPQLTNLELAEVLEERGAKAGSLAGLLRRSVLARFGPGGTDATSARTHGEALRQWLLAGGLSES